MSGTNTYLKKLSTIRPYLRLLATGRIHIDDFPNGIKTKIRDNRTRLHHVLKEMKHRKKKIGRKDYENLSTDSYMNNNNYLVDIYRIKSFTKEEISILLLLLQIVNENSGEGKEGISKNELLDYITMMLPDKSAIENTIKRYITNLYNNRIIYKGNKCSVNKKNSVSRYYFGGNPLANLTSEEYRELVLAVGFYKNISLLSLLGYFIETKLMDMYSHEKLPMIPVQFHRRSMVNIIDEEIVYHLYCARYEYRLVQVKYHKRSDDSKELKKKVYPIKIQERFFHGDRQYLICIPFQNNDWSEHLLTIPLENIHEVKISEPICKPLPNELPHNEQYDMSLGILCDTKNKQENLITIIRHLSSKATVEFEQILNEAYYCIVNIKTPEPSSFIPFIQSNYPDIVLISGPEYIIKRIKNNIKETLDNYGEK